MIKYTLVVHVIIKIYGSCYYKNIFNGYDLEQCLLHHILPMNIINILFFH